MSVCSRKDTKASIPTEYFIGMTTRDATARNAKEADRNNMTILERIIRLNTKIAEGFAKVQWLFYVTLGSGAVTYALSFLHLAILGVLAPVILVLILYIIGDAHEAKQKV